MVKQPRPAAILALGLCLALAALSQAPAAAQTAHKAPATKASPVRAPAAKSTPSSTPASNQPPSEPSPPPPPPTPEEIGERAADLLLVCGSEARAVASDEEIGSPYNQTVVAMTTSTGTFTPMREDLIRAREKGEDQLIDLAVWVANQDKAEKLAGNAPIEQTGYFGTPPRAALGHCMASRRLDQIAGARLQALPPTLPRAANAYLTDATQRGQPADCVRFEDPTKNNPAVVNGCPASVMIYFCFLTTTCQVGHLDALDLIAGQSFYFNPSSPIPPGSGMHLMTCWANQTLRFTSTSPFQAQCLPAP